MAKKKGFLDTVTNMSDGLNPVETVKITVRNVNLGDPLSGWRGQGKATVGSQTVAANASSAVSAFAKKKAAAPKDPAAAMKALNNADGKPAGKPGAGQKTVHVAKKNAVGQDAGKPKSATAKTAAKAVAVQKTAAKMAGA